MNKKTAPHKRFYLIVFAAAMQKWTLAAEKSSVVELARAHAGDMTPLFACSGLCCSLLQPQPPADVVEEEIVIKLQRACDAFERPPDSCSKAEGAFGAAWQRSQAATECCFPGLLLSGSGLRAPASQLRGVEMLLWRHESDPVRRSRSGTEARFQSLSAKLNFSPFW